MSPAQRATGTVRRSDLRHPKPAPSRVSWPLVVAAFLIAALAAAWLLGRGSQQPAASLPTESRSPQPTLVANGATASTASTLAPTLSPAPEASPSPTRRPVRPTPSAAPTLLPETPRPTQPLPSQSPGLTIVFPSDGEALNDAQINVVGTGPPGATVTRDIPLAFDDHVTVQVDGSWLMPVSLGQGVNTLRFRLGDDRSTEQVLNVTYTPRG